MAPTFPSGIRLFETYTSFLGSYVQTGVVPLSVFNGTHDKFDGKSVVVVNVNIDASAKNYQAFNFATNSNTHAVFPLVIPSVPEKQIEPPHDKTSNMACAPSEDSDQPGQTPSLTRVFAVASGAAKDPSFLHADSEDSVQTGRMPFCWFCHEAAQYYMNRSIAKLINDVCAVLS